jgi:hypothetical protein
METLAINLGIVLATAIVIGNLTGLIIPWVFLSVDSIVTPLSLQTPICHIIVFKPIRTGGGDETESGGIGYHQGRT